MSKYLVQLATSNHKQCHKLTWDKIDRRSLSMHIKRTQKISRMVEHHNENKPGYSILPAQRSSSWPMTICGIISPNFPYEKMPALAFAFVMLPGQSTVKAKNRMKIGHDDESIAFLDFKGYSEPAISRMPKTFFRLTTMPPPWWRQPEPKRNSAWRAACVVVPYHTRKWQWQKSKFASTRRLSNYLSYCLQIWSWRQDRAKKWDYIPRSYLLSSE